MCAENEHEILDAASINLQDLLPFLHDTQRGSPLCCNFDIIASTTKTFPIYNGHRYLLRFIDHSERFMSTPDHVKS